MFLSPSCAQQLPYLEQANANDIAHEQLLRVAGTSRFGSYATIFLLFAAVRACCQVQSPSPAFCVRPPLPPNLCARKTFVQG